jgi:hypothetical protein
VIITMHGMAGPLTSAPREELAPDGVGYSVHGASNELKFYFHSIEAAERMADAALSIVAQMRARAAVATLEAAE